MKIAQIQDGKVIAVKSGSYTVKDLQENEVEIPSNADHNEYLYATYDADTQTFGFESDEYIREQAIRQGTIQPPQPIAAIEVTAHRRAFLKALSNMNWLTVVQEYVAELEPDNDMRLIWENVTVFERKNPDMILFSTVGMSEENIDMAFKLARSY